MNNFSSESKKIKRYRRGVGVIILNKKRKIFIGQRFDKDKAAWQMPQGGIDRGEKAIEAAKREMQEETGIKKNFRVIHESHDWHYYDLPMHLQKKLWRGRYVGQKQRWYVIDFYGSDNEINIKTKRPEFQTWRWSTKNEILKLIVPFKSKLYKSVFKEFDIILGSIE